MATAITEKELLELERQYWQAMKDGDAEAAIRLTDDTCIVSGPQGVGSIDRQAIAEMFKAATWKLQKFAFKDGAKMRKLGDDVAILAYEVHEELTVEGQPIPIKQQRPRPGSDGTGDGPARSTPSQSRAIRTAATGAGCPRRLSARTSDRAMLPARARRRAPSRSAPGHDREQHAGSDEGDGA